MKIKPGDEVETIEKWNTPVDEIEELKKVFFEFLKRWVEIDTNAASAVNEPFLYTRLKTIDGRKEEPFRLSGPN